MTDRHRPFTWVVIASVLLVVVTTACGGTATSSSTGGAGSAEPAASADPAAAMSIEAPDEVTAGATFEVSWTGEPGSGDYLVILPIGASTAADAPYVNMSVGAPATLTAPADPGEYEIWWVEGDTADDVHARHDLTVT